MKRIFILLTLTIILTLQLTQAGGVGITPVYYKEFFEPGLVKTYTFHSFSSNPDEGIDLYVKGDLSKYFNLSTKHLLGSGEFTVTMNLPEEIAVPGTHKVYIGASEVKNTSDVMVGGIATIQGRIDILVPYPGQYSESTFKMSNINEGEEAPYELEIQSLGTEGIIVNSKIEIYKVNTSEILVTKIIPEKQMKSKTTLNIMGTLATKKLPPGEYEAFATVDWGKKKIVLNQTFRIGEFLIDITDYDYQFEQGKINPFNIKIANKWNTKIDKVFATVSITDQGRFITDFKTVSVDTNPWEIKKITGYLDATNLEPKRYTAKITLSYGGATTSKLVAIYINLPPQKVYKKYIILAIIIGLVIISIIIYLIWKIKNLEKNKNEKKK